MPEDTVEAFNQAVLPHLDAAYNLARWLVRNPHDAEDVVQEAYLRARKFFDGYRGGDSRAWILRIVRNTSYTFLQKNRSRENDIEFDEKVHAAEDMPPDAEAALLQSIESRQLREAIEALPANFREVLILREFEGMSYKQIAEVIDAPIGTVMSGLARGRAQLRAGLLKSGTREERRGLSK